MEHKFFGNQAVYVGTVALRVANLKRSIDFYRDITGFHVIEQTDKSAVLSADGKTPLLSLTMQDHAEVKEERTTGLYHFAILLPSRRDLAAFLRHMIQKNIQLGAADHLVSEALYFSDPDGNGIEVYHDRSASGWNWTNGQVVMAAEQLDGNSILQEHADEWNGLPPETIIGHIHLHVGNLRQARDFYDMLGFTVVSTYPGALFISSAGYHHHIGLNVWNGEDAPQPGPQNAGLHYFTLVYPNEVRRLEAAERLQQMGIQVKRDGHAYITADPFGNSIHLLV